MTRVIFYADIADQNAFLHRFLYQKVFLAGQTALVYGQEEMVKQLDDRLWYRDFLPHAYLDDDTNNRDNITPIILTNVAPPLEYSADLLVSLQAELPLFFGRFPVYVDVVGTGEADKKQARKRYRYFQEHGYTIDCHSMKDGGER